MNVLLYVNSFFPSLGGKEFVVHHLASALSTLGHEVRVVGPAGWWKHRHVRPGYPVHRWPTLRGLLREQVLWTNLALDTAVWGCDVIHAHVTYPSGYIALKLRRRRRCPVIVTPHGADIQTIPEIGHGLRLDPVLNEKIVSTVKAADFVTAISENIESVILEAGVDRDRVKLVPNGVDLERFNRAASSRAKEHYGLAKDARLIVTVGRYNPRKGFDYLVRSMPGILRAEPLARLVIVGQDTEVLAPLIDDLGLQGKVVLTGGINPPTHMFMSRGDAVSGSKPDPYAELLCASEVYVSAGIHRNSEGLSLAVLEGMAAGLPVVATSISGNTDVVLNNENGLLVEPGDEDALTRGLVRILAENDERSRMSRGARETASRYGWLGIANRYLEVYEEALSAFGRHA